MNNNHSTVKCDEVNWVTLFDRILKDDNVPETFKTLRNLCSQSEENRIRCKEIISYCFTEGVRLIRNNYVAWQFIANASVSPENCEIFRSYLTVVEEIVIVADEKTVNAIYMCIHNCFRNLPDFELNDKLICVIIDNIQLEFPLIVAENIVKSSGTFHGTKLVEFLQIITSHTLVHPHISAQFLDHVKEVYKTNVDDVLKSKIHTENVQLTQSVTEFLSIVAPHHKQLQSDASLLTSVIYILKMTEESEQCEPKRSMDDLKKIGQMDGIVNLKGDLVKLITSLCHQNNSNQNLVYECGVVPVILDNMRYDARNPFIREACIHCIQVLCENNQNIQQFISQFTIMSEKTVTI